MKEYDFRLSQEAWQKGLETYTKAKRQMEESRQQLHQSLDKIEQGWNSEGGRDTVERGRKFLEEGGYNISYQRISKMQQMFEEYSPRIEELLLRQEQFPDQLKSDEYVEPPKSAGGRTNIDGGILAINYAAMKKSEELCEKTCEIAEHWKNGMLSIMEDCADLIPETEMFKERLQTVYRAVMRVDNLRQSMQLYRRGVEDLEADINRDLRAALEIGSEKEEPSEKPSLEGGRRIVAQKVQAAQEQLDWVESLQKQFAQLQSVREQSVPAQPTGMQSAQMQPAQGQSTSTKDSKETIPSWSQLLTRSELTEKEQEQLCRELETLCKEQDETQLKEVYRLLLLETYETRTTGSGEYLYYSLETDQTKTELLKNKSKALGLTRTEKLMKSLETLDTEAVRVADKTSGSFTIETYETKEPGEIRLLLAVSYTVKDGLPKEGYSREILLETDPDVDAMTDEEVVQFMEKTDNAFLLARIIAKGKQKVYNKRQQLARRYYGIKRQQGKEQALAYGILEDLPYLFGEVPYLDGEELTAWSERQKEAFQRYLQLVEQGVDFTWIENYYRTEAMKEAEKELEEELEEELEDSAKSPLDHSIDSILMKPLASLGAGAYQLYGFVTGTPLDPENGMYGGIRRVELIRRVVAEGFEEDLPGKLAEALYEVALGVADLGIAELLTQGKGGALVGIEAYADTGYQAVQRGLSGTAVQSEAVLAATGDMLLEKLLRTSLLEAGTSYLKEMCRGGFVGAGTERP